MTRSLWRGALVALLLLAGPLSAAILVRSNSPVTIAVGVPIVRVEDSGTSGCVTTPNRNATGGSLAVTSTSGTTDYGACVDLRNTATSTRVFKVRYVSGTNEGRFNDVQIKSSGGTQHMKWSSGTLTVSETASWQTISAGATTTINARVRIDSGPASVIASEILVARSGLPNVYVVYPLTITFSAT